MHLVGLFIELVTMRGTYNVKITLLLWIFPRKLTNFSIIFFFHSIFYHLFLSTSSTVLLTLLYLLFCPSCTPPTFTSLTLAGLQEIPFRIVIISSNLTWLLWFGELFVENIISFDNNVNTLLINFFWKKSHIFNSYSEGYTNPREHVTMATKF